MGRIVEREPGLIEFFASAEWLPVCRNEFGHEVQAKDVRGLGIEGGIGDGALAVADLGNHGTRAEQMGLIRRRPFRHGPECIHHSSWTVRKFVGKPPLRRERGMSVAGKSLEISDPVVRTERSISIGDVAGLGKVERLRRGQPGDVPGCCRAAGAWG